MQQSLRRSFVCCFPCDLPQFHSCQKICKVFFVALNRNQSCLVSLKQFSSSSTFLFQPSTKEDTHVASVTSAPHLYRLFWLNWLDVLLASVSATEEVKILAKGEEVWATTITFTKLYLCSRTSVI